MKLIDENDRMWRALLTIGFGSLLTLVTICAQAGEAESPEIAALGHEIVSQGLQARAAELTLLRERMSEVAYWSGHRRRDSLAWKRDPAYPACVQGKTNCPATSITAVVGVHAGTLLAIAGDCQPAAAHDK